MAAEYTEDQLWNMSEDALEAAFLEASAADSTGVDEFEEEEAVEQEQEETIIDDTEVEEVEQPDEQDSDDDTSTDDEVDDDESEDSESDESDLDGDTDEDEEQTEDDADDAEEEVQPVEDDTDDFMNKVHKFKANGLEHEMTTKEMMEMFPAVFGKASDYTKKTQAIKPYRKMIDAIEQEKISQDDLNLLIDVRKGDKEAIAELLKRTGVDALELETDESKTYTPKDYGRDAKALDLDETIRELQEDQDTFKVTQKLLSSEWDDDSYKKMVESPELIKGLQVDIKSGFYDKIAPTISKMKTRDSVMGHVKTDLEYYAMATNAYMENETAAMRQAEADKARAEAEARKEAEAKQVAEVKEKSARVKSNKDNAAKRKAATPPKKAAATTKVTDYLDEDDNEAFDAWYKNLQDRM